MSAHIVHIVHRFDTGGMENGMVNLFNTLPPQRFRHSVVALTDFSDFRQRISAQPVAFYALHRAPGNGLGWGARLWRLLRARRRARRWQAPIGILTHHRNLDEDGWAFLAGFLEKGAAANRRLRWHSAQTLLAASIASDRPPS